MIVKICDSCQKLLFDQEQCVWVAIREHGALLFKKWQSGMADKSTVSHFCSSECAIHFCADWFSGVIPEPVPSPAQVEANRVHNERFDEAAELAYQSPPVVEPTPQEVAEQNALMRSLGI